MFVLKILARELILPPTSLLLLTLIGAWLIWRQRRIGWVLFIVGFGSLWALCTPIVADRLMQLAEKYPGTGSDQTCRCAGGCGDRRR